MAQTAKIGVLIPKSGPAGLFGPSSQNAATLAAEQINARGGLAGQKIELLFGDVGVPPAEAVQTAMGLWKGKGVKAFIGMHDSAVREALIGRFGGQVPYVYTPVYEGGECSPSVFIVGETPDQQLKPVLPWISKKEKVSKWYLIGNDYNWPRDTNKAAKEYIAAAGGSVVGEEYLPFTVNEFDTSLQRIKSSGADAVLITLVGGASVNFNRAFSSFGMDKQAIRLGTLIEENTLAGIGKENSKRLYSSAAYFASLQTPSAKTLMAAYTKRFGKEAAVLNTLGQSTYDGLLLLEALAKKAGSLDAQALEKAAEGVSFSGPRGTATMRGKHVAQSIYIADGSSGTFEVIKSFDNVSPGNNCK
jgi:ABC-type branched-subunit amino acid transport system substrate-binding protein